MTTSFCIHPLPEYSSDQRDTLVKKLNNIPWFVWLDSADANHADARYEILAWQPEHKLYEQHGSFYLDGKLVDDPFDAMHSLLAQHPIDDTSLPFCGGWLGYMAYDLGRHIESLPEMAQADISHSVLAMGFYKAALIRDMKQDCWYVSGERHAVTALLDELAQLSKHPTPELDFQLTTNWQSNLNKASYRDKFNRIQHYLREGDCYQINLAQRFSARYEGAALAAYLKLRNANHAPFSAYMVTEQGYILSASPERFIQLKQGQIETKPIKGTRPRSHDAKDDKAIIESLKRAPKDNAENLMIVDLLRNDIGKVAKPGSVKVPKLFDVESFPAVHHLVSTITAELAEDANGVDLLRGAFPGGSITGAPKLRAMEIIEELEPHRRSIYCGSFAYMSLNGNIDSSITIRTLVCEQNQIHCWAGGGIVADSDCESEYQETLDKVSKILPLLASRT